MGKAKEAKAAPGNVLDVLGNHKQLTPEQAKALQKLGKIKQDNGGFETILKDSQKNQMPETKGDVKELLSTGKKQIPALQLKKESVQANPKFDMETAPVLGKKQGLRQTAKLHQSALNSQVKPELNVHNKDILNQAVSPEVAQVKMPMKQAINHQVTPQGDTQIARVLKLGQSKNLKASQNNPQVDQAKLGNQSEAINIKAAQAPKVAQAAKMMNPLNQGIQAQAQVLPQQAMPTAAAIASTQLATNKAPIKNSNLVDFDTFMKKQNPQTRNRIATQHNIYENKNKSMFNAKKIDDSLPEVVRKPATQTKLQDVMYGSKSENMSTTMDQQMNNSNMQVMTKAAPVAVGAEQTAKVFDMSNMNASMKSDEVIAKIQDYAIQTKFSNEPQLDFTFNHSELGQVDLTVQKAAGDQLNIMIGANSVEGIKFFNQNQGELLQSLTQAGISVGDFKLDSSSKSNNQNLSQNSSGNGQGTHKEHQSESGQRQEERQRRSDLWDQIKDKEAA